MNNANPDIIAIVQKAIKEKKLLISKEEWLKCELFMRNIMFDYVVQNIPDDEQAINTLCAVLPLEYKAI